MKFIWVEIWKFIKNNLIKIIIGTLALATIFVVVSKRNMDTQLTNLKEEADELVFEIDSRPASFQFYIELMDGTSFHNNTLIEQYITTPEQLQEASNETNTKLINLVRETENKALVDYSDSGETKIIGITRDTNTNLMEFYVNVGNENDNMKIANYYFNYLLNDNVPFLSDKEITIFYEPAIVKLDEDLETEDTEISTTSSFNLWKNAFIGLVVGLVVTTGLLLFYTFVSKKLKYSFSYSIKADDYFILSDNRLKNEDELTELFNQTNNSDTKTISETDLTDRKVLVNVSNNNMDSYRSILEIPNLEEATRIIYIIEENKTNRSWYNNQRNLEKAYDVPVIVLQINEH